MTKQIRIENADTSDHKVTIYVEEKLSNGSWNRIRSVDANYPTSLINEYIHQTQRLVIEETK